MSDDNVQIPRALLNELAQAAQDNLARYIRDHGRFATRHQYKPGGAGGACERLSGGLMEMKPIELDGREYLCDGDEYYVKCKTSSGSVYWRRLAAQAQYIRKRIYWADKYGETPTARQ